MARVVIRGRDDLERWLAGQPREIAVAIAARAAMRVIPILELWLADDEKNAISIVLLIFRAVASSQLAAVEQRRDADRTATTVAELTFAAAATVADIANTTSTDIAKAIANTANAAAFAVEAAFAADVVFAINNAANAVEASAFAAILAATVTHTIIVSSLTASDIWRAVETDANFLIREKAEATSLINQPLWPDGMPEELRQLWAAMKKRLEARTGEHWDVWTNWYEARLEPSREIPCYSPPILELERKRILELKEEDWGAGPAVANTKIKELIKKHGCLSDDDQPGNEDDDEIDEQAIVSVLPTPVGSDLNGKFIMVATPFATQRHENSALLSIALPWRTLANLVPDPLEVLLESSDDSLRLERAQSGEEILWFLSEDEETYIVLERLLDSGEASIYFGSIESLISEALKGKSPSEILKGFARLSKRQYRVGIIRIAGAIIILGIASGIAYGSYLFLSKVGGELGGVVASRLQEATKKNLEKSFNTNDEQKGAPDAPDMTDI